MSNNKLYLHNIDLNKNQIVNPVLHNATTAPLNPADGQLYYNTTTKKVYYYNITTATWTEVGAVYNIYNLDGTLTGARVVTMGANNLTFQQGTYGSAGEFIIKGASTNATVVGVKFKVSNINRYYDMVTATGSQIMTWRDDGADNYMNGGSWGWNGATLNNISTIQYGGNLNSLGSGGNYTLSLKSGATANDFGRIVAYTNGSSLTEMQSLEFGYYKTNLNSNYEFSNTNYNEWGFRVYGTITGTATGGGVYSSLLINPTLNITGNTNGSTYYGVLFAPTSTSITNTTVYGFANTIGTNLLNSSSGNTYIGYSAVPSGSYKFDVSGSARVTGSKYVGAVNFSVGDVTYPYSGTYPNQSGVFQVLDAGSGNTQIVLRPSTASVGSLHSSYWSSIQQGLYELFITTGAFQTFSLGNGGSKKLKLYAATSSGYNTLYNTVHVTDATYLAVGNITATVPTLTLVSSTSTIDGTGVFVEGSYYYRVVFYDWAGQIATQSTEQAVTFGTGVTTGKVNITIGNGNLGNGIFAWRIFRRYLAPGQNPVINANNPYTNAYAASSSNTSIVDLGTGGGQWTTGTYSQEVLATNVSSYAGIRADGWIYGRQVNTGTINFFDQGQIGVTSDGVTYATQHNSTGIQYKALGFMGDLRFGSSSSVQSVYYFGAKYGGSPSSSGTYLINNLFTLTTTYDKIGVTLSTSNNIVTNILNITPIYAYTNGTGHTIRGIYYNPTVTSITGVVNHYAFHAASGDVYIENGNVGLGGTPNASYRLNVNGNTNINGILQITNNSIGRITGGNYVNSRPIMFMNAGTSGAFNGGYLFYGGASGTDGVPVMHIYSNGTTDANSQVAIGEISESILQSSTKSRLIIKSRVPSANASNYDDGAILYCGTDYNYTNSKIWSALSIGIINGTSAPSASSGTIAYGVSIGFQIHPLTNGWGSSMIFSARNDSATMNEIMRVQGRDSSVGIGTTQNNSTAILQIDSTTRGFLPPRLTYAQASTLAGASPSVGLLIYVTSTSGATTFTSEGWWGYTSTGWVRLN